jgi:hypothetical protein
MKIRTTSTGAALAVFALMLVAAGGWVANVVKLAGSSFADITGILVLRVVGIFVPPLGSVLGFF